MHVDIVFRSVRKRRQHMTPNCTRYITQALRKRLRGGQRLRRRSTSKYVLSLWKILSHINAFQVKWSRVPDLVEKRRVFLKRGWAYVPSQEQSSIIFQEFETQLDKALEMTARLLPRLDEDARLVPILNNLSQGFIAGSSSDWMNENGEANGEELRAEMIDDLSKKHFPMCMKTLHDRLQRDNHLKHFGRLQYGLFLKASPYLIFLEFRSRFHCPGSRTVSRRSGRLLEKVIQ